MPVRPLLHRVRRVGGVVPLLCVALLACAGAGQRFGTAHVEDLRRGVQDEQQVRAWFGEPVRIERLRDHPAGCTERWTYVHARSTAGGKRSEALVVDFDPNDLVCDHAYVEE